MSVILARVDQRLIHGLIVNQWAQALQVKRFMVVDDELSTNEVIKAFRIDLINNTLPPPLCFIHHHHPFLYSFD